MFGRSVNFLTDVNEEHSRLEKKNPSYDYFARIELNYGRICFILLLWFLLFYVFEVNFCAVCTLCAFSYF